MKRILSLIIALILASFGIPAFAGPESGASGLRQIINFNREWKFKLGDEPDAATVAHDDKAWDSVGLPHSFSMPYFASEDFYVGFGWYRKHLNVSEAWRGKRMNLEFDGAFQVTEIFVNGTRIGEHRGGYNGFTFDITDAVKVGDNIVAVRVNNQWDAKLAPRAGEHTFSGGIYRNVRLVVTSPLHVAWYGTFVTTPELSKESGKVNVKTEIVNDLLAVKSTTVETRVFDAEGKEVAVMSSTQSIKANSAMVFDQTSSLILQPKLWHPNHPYLYSVKTTVLEDGKAVDDFNSPLGFRWFKFTADKGFYLNGEHYYFRGANVHQDHAGWGDAVADRGFYRDVKMVRDAGFDFIRGSHYPHAPAFSRACDELGVLFWSENCFWGTAGFKHSWCASAYPPEQEYQTGFEQSVKDSLREMIRIHRNHPSIITWGMDNEVFFTAESTMPNVRELLKQTVALVHELDPTRPAAIGGCQRGEIDKIGDVAGYNGDGARLFIDPGIPSVVTEYGSTMAERPGNYEPGWGDLQQERFAWRSGEAIWCAFDHGSIAGRKFGGMGMIDYFRLPKRQWYWYRNAYKKIPPPEWPAEGVPAELKLTTDQTTLKSADGTDDAHIVVTVLDAAGRALSNSPPVTLTVESGPGEFPTGPSITFALGSDIAIRDGQAAIEFRSYHAGKSLIRGTSPGMKDAVIEIFTLGAPQFVAGETPLVKPRPYVGFAAPPEMSALSIFGLENPTRASSEAADHSGRFANDGKVDTFWQAADEDENPWLRVDLERIVTVRGTKLTFPAAGDWRYKIEVSDDGESHWKLVADQSQMAVAEGVRQDSAAPAARGRFLRVTIFGYPHGHPPSLSEIEVSGVSQ